MKNIMKKRLIIIASALFIFLLINVAITYSFFRAKPLNNESESTVIVSVGSASITYSTDDPDINAQDIRPGYEYNKKFSLTSTLTGENNENFKLYYAIYLNVVLNEFEDNSFNYSLSIDGASSTDGLVATTVTKKGIPKLLSETKVLMGMGYFVKDNITHTYNLNISYPNLDVDQSAEIGRKFNAYVLVEGIHPVNIKLDYGDGNIVNMLSAKNTIVDLPTPERTDYKFLGWELISGDAELNGNSVLVNSSDITLKAKWDATFVNLQIDLQGGTSEEIQLNQTILKNSSITIPAPTKADNTFVGWTIAGASSVMDGDTLKVGTEDVKLTANWVQTVNIFDYTGAEQIFAVPISGNYKVELWGAQGHGAGGANGGYVSGNILLEKNDTIYLYIGGMPSNNLGGYNGGGQGYSSTAGGGGGATDVRFFQSTPSTEDLLWNSSLGLSSRIMVAAGGGGNSGNSRYKPGYGGGLIGTTAYDTSYASYTSTGGTQVSGGIVTNYSSSYSAGTNGKFGIGGNGGGAANGGSFGGGGGYYGGAGGSRLSSGNWPAGGGSSYISGHTGCVAINSSTDITPKTSCTTGTSDNNCSIHYSGKVFTNTLMIDGSGYTWTNAKSSTVGTNLMPNPSGGTYQSGVGHSGNGYAKITLLSVD